MGYPLPGMQLHVVAGRGATAGTQQYAQYVRHQPATRNYAYPATEKQQAVKFTERGVPEGAASVSQSDTIMSPVNQQGTQHNSLQMATSTAASASSGGAVFYAMNV